MKIVQIVVDKLPESASQCFAAAENWNPLTGIEEIGCRFTVQKVFMSVQKFYTKRRQNCPLVEAKESEK